MMFLPTLKQLQYFVALVELRHFGLAAERCFVTQSTLSSGIQELELLLGASLFERSNRKVLVTPLAQQLLPSAQQMLQLANHMVEQVKQGQTELTGDLKLGAIPTIAPFLLPQVLPGLRARFPALKLWLQEDQSARLLEKLNTGELDCAILALPYSLGNMQQQVFWQENFWIALPAQHPQASALQLNSSQLPPDQLLLLEEGHCLRDQVLLACQHARANSAHFHGTSLYTLLDMVASGQGITLLPEMALHSQLAEHAAVRFIPLNEPGPHREIALVWRNTSFRQGEFQQLATELGNTLKNRGR